VEWQIVPASVRPTGQLLLSFQVLLAKRWLTDAFGFEGNPICEPTSDRRDPDTKALGGVNVADARRILIGITLPHGPDPRAQPIEITAGTAAPVIAWQITHAHPYHPHLHGKHAELQQGRQFVATLRSRVGKAGRDLVFPSLLKPVRLKGGFQKRLEDG